MDAISMPIQSTSGNTGSVVPHALASFFLIMSIGLAVVHMHRDYRAFLDLGPGGTPSTFAGYLRVTALGPFALKERYEHLTLPEEQLHSKGYLEDIPRRERPRPATKGIAPHRQIDQKADQRMFDTLMAAIENLAAEHDNLILTTSCYEKHTMGLFWISPSKEAEICHAHPSDGSLHMTLHPADVNTVLELGWGERHPLARGGWLERFVPRNFVMIYAPHDGMECTAVLKFIVAAAWFISGGGIASGMAADND